MAKPWEKYQQPANEGAKPWEKYQAESVPTQRASQTQVPSRQYDKPSDFQRMKSNLIPSAIQLADDVTNVVRHPLDTAEGMANLFAGIGDKVTGQDSPEAKKRIEGVDAVGRFFKERYIDSPYESAIQDPVGMSTDILGLISGGAGTVAKVPRLAKVATTTKKIADTLDIVNQAGRVVGGTANVVGRFGSEIFGKTTGTGAGSVQRAANASPNFMKGLYDKEKVTQGSVVDEARNMVSQVADIKRQEYQADMAKIKEWSEPIDGTPIATKIDELNKTFGVNVKIADDGSFVGVERGAKSKLNTSDLADVETVIKEIEDWRNHPDNKFTPEDLDVLKVRIGDVYSESSKARGYVDAMYNTVKDEITKVVPQYETAMTKYSTFMDLEKELKSTLSLKDGTSIDAAFKKLSSTFRSNFEGRNEILKAVKDLGIDADSVLDKVAGLQMRDLTAKGLMGQMSIGAGLTGGGLTAAGVMNWQVLPVIAATSPRAVGSFLSGVGWSTRQVNKFLNAPIVRQLKKGTKGATTTAGRALTSNMSRYSDLINNQLQPQESQ